MIVQSIAFGATQTGVSLATDVGRGVTDRSRSLPISRSAVVAGRALVDTGRNALLAVIVLLLGLAIGVRPHGSPAAVALALAVVVAFGSPSPGWRLVGVTVRHAEAVHDAGFVWVIPLTFASSALVAVDSMPAAVRWFARVNPVTERGRRRAGADAR